MKRKYTDPRKAKKNLFIIATREEERRQSLLYGDVDSSSASDAVRAAKRRHLRPAQVVKVQNTALAVQATAAQRLAAWRDLTRTFKSLEEDDQQIFAKQYAVLAAAARRNMDPEKALKLYSTLKEKIEERKKLTKDDAEKKRKEGMKKRYTRLRIKTDGTRRTEVSTLVRTADEHVAAEARHAELLKMDPKERPMYPSQTYAPGKTPLRDQSGVDTSSSPKAEKPGTRKNGVYQCKDRTFTVNRQYYTGPKMKLKYFKTRAEADAQRAEWVRNGWLPEPRASRSAEAKAHFVSGKEESGFWFNIPKSCPKTGATWKDADLLKLGVPKGKKKGQRPANVKRVYYFKKEAAAIEFAKKMLKWLRDPKRAKSKVPTL